MAITVRNVFFIVVPGVIADYSREDLRRLLIIFRGGSLIFASKVSFLDAAELRANVLLCAVCKIELLLLVLTQY